MPALVLLEGKNKTITLIKVKTKCLQSDRILSVVAQFRYMPDDKYSSSKGAYLGYMFNIPISKQLAYNFLPVFKHSKLI